MAELLGTQSPRLQLRTCRQLWAGWTGTWPMPDGCTRSAQADHSTRPITALVRLVPMPCAKPSLTLLLPSIVCAFTYLLAETACLTMASARSSLTLPASVPVGQLSLRTCSSRPQDTTTFDGPMHPPADSTGHRRFCHIQRHYCICAAFPCPLSLPLSPWR